MREYTKRPEVQIHRKEYSKIYWKKTKEKLKPRLRKYFQTHREQFKKYNEKYMSKPEAKAKRKHYEQTTLKESRWTKKRTTMEHYSGKPAHCQICGEQEIKFLTIDHIEGKKKVGHKRSLTGSKIIGYLIRNNYPTGYQVLDFNCNCAKSFVFGLKPEPQIFKSADIKHYYKKRKFNEQLKHLVLSHYSDGITAKCMCCGTDKLEWLTIDHINGKKDLSVNPNKGGMPLYRWLFANNYPSGFQCLCYSCNYCKGKYGICPHQEPKPHIII